MISPGQYKGRGIKGSVQLGETEQGNLQIALDMDLKDAKGASLGSMTTFLYFTPGAAPYSYERLRALGWQGNGPEDIDGNLAGIDANEVDVRVTVPEPYTKDGQTKMGASKLEILSGTGKVNISKPLDADTFRNRLRALGGGGPAAGGKPPTGGGGPNPPF